MIQTEAQKLKIEMLSAVSKRGKLHFLMYKDSMNSEKLIDFMTCLVKDSKKKVFLILDNLRVHHSKLVTAWVEEHKAQIELFFLPPYAPEYNPDELLNSDIKRNAGARQSPRSQAELKPTSGAGWTIFLPRRLSSQASSVPRLPPMPPEFKI